jgi:MFS family permease
MRSPQERSVTVRICCSAESFSRSALAKRAVQRPQLRSRWPALVLICLLMIGNFYIYDNPAALKSYLGDRFDSAGLPGFPGTDWEDVYGLLYSVYALPNVVLPFFGGAIVDRVGTRRSLVVLGVAITLAQCIFAAGVSIRSIWLTLVGRVLYGLAGETFTVAQNVILAEWFAGRELAFSFGITLSFCRSGSVLNNYFSPFLAEKLSLDFSVWFGAIVCAACVACIFALVPYELATSAALKRLARHHRAGGGSAPRVRTVSVAGRAVSVDRTDSTGSESSIKKYELLAAVDSGRTSFDLASAPAPALRLDDSVGSEAGGAVDVAAGADHRRASMGAGSQIVPAPARTSVEGSADERAFREKRRCLDDPHAPRCGGRYRCFGAMFWLMVGSTVCGYGVVQTFQNTASSMLLERDLFKRAKPIEECCCWAPGQCYASWPDASFPGNSSAQIFPRRDANGSVASNCTAGCAFGAHFAPTLNLSAAQLVHFSCDPTAAHEYGLVGDPRLGYGVPAVPQHAEYLALFCREQAASLTSAGVYMSIP